MAERGGAAVDLQPRRFGCFNSRVRRSPRRELDALELLLRRTGSVVSKTTMESMLYSFGEEIASNAVEVVIHRLRKRLLDANAAVAIHTIRGVGYMLLAEAPASV